MATLYDLRDPEGSVPQHCFNILIHKTQEFPRVDDWSIILYKSLVPYTPPPSPGDHSPVRIHYCHRSREATPENDPNPAARLYFATGYAGHFERRFYKNYYFMMDHTIKERVIIADDMFYEDWRDAERTVRRTPVDNTNPYYSSQLWVFDVLDELYSKSVFHTEDFLYAHGILATMHQGIEDLYMMMDE